MHTPGPWRLSNTISAYECNRRKIVASEDSPEPGTGICEVYGIEDECNVANARLIAAAPDLLEACKLAFAACQDNLKMYMYKNEELLHKAFEACKAAIEKATTDAAQTTAIGGDHGK